MCSVAVNMEGNIIEEPTSHQQLECIVNRWLVDYYFFLAIDAVRNDKYSEFCEVRDVLERLLHRPLECTKAIPSKIRVLQFLSRINDGEKLDMVFESDDSVSPLESAVEVLRNLSDKCSISQEVIEKVCTSIKEMLVVICLKNGEFEKAKEILTKHFSCGMMGKKAILMGLANQKVKSHDILEQTNFKKFKEDMVNFTVQLFPTSEPFLYKAAKQLVEKRLVDLGESNQGDSAVEEEAYLADTSKDNTAVCLISGLAAQDQLIEKYRLMAAYTALSKNSNETNWERVSQDHMKDHPGSDTVFCDAQLRPGRISRVDSGSPRDACVVGKPPATESPSQSHSPSSQRPGVRQRPRRLYSVAQLLQEPDSQVSTQELDAEFDSPRVEVESRAAEGSLLESTHKKRRVTLTPKSPELQRWAAAASEDSNSDIFKSPTSTESHDDNEEDNLSIINSSGPTPQKTAKTKGKLLDSARESKEIWSEEESLFISKKEKTAQKNDMYSGSNSKKSWSEEESNILKEAVARFGEGNWAKIMGKYKFENRTNVNLKDRWRTMKRLKLV
ncbi:unnamed protein product [Arctogadus glacialis]